MNLKEKISTEKEKLVEKFKKIKDENEFESLIKNKIVIGIIIFSFIFYIGYSIGGIKMSKESLIKNFREDLIKGDKSDLDDILVIDGKKIKKERLEPLVSYYKGKEDLVNILINEIRNGNSKLFQIKKYKSFILDKYNIELKPVSLKINKSYDDEKIFLNGKEVNGNKKISNLIPGEYSIKSILKGEYGDIIYDEKIILNKDEIINSKIKANYITIHSKFKNAKVYINGKDTGKDVSEFSNVGPFKTNGEISISIEDEFPWGKVKSKEIKVYDKPDITLEIDMKNEKVFSDIKREVFKFYNSVFKGLNDENKNLIEACTNNVKEKIYSILKKKYFLFKNLYTIKSINIDEEKSTLNYESEEYNATIVCDVDYSISKILFNIAEKDKNAKFFTKMIYKNGKWIVSDVENFSL